jgi:hypothetical protein
MNASAPITRDASAADWLLTGLPRAGAAPTQASITDLAADRTDAVAFIRKRLLAARAPVLAGVEDLTLEAAQAALDLATRLQARVVSRRPTGLRFPPAIAFHAISGWIARCDALAWCGFDRQDGGVAAALVPWLRALREGPGRLHLQLTGDLAHTSALRSFDSPHAALRELGPPASTDRLTRLGVLLSPRIADERVSRVWHELAGRWQNSVRVAVAQLPTTDSLWARTASEVALWRTGLSLDHGGIDFADGVALRCPDLHTLLARGAADLVLALTAGAARQAVDAGLPTLALAPQPVRGALAFVATRGLCRGIQARAITWDGEMVRLADDGAGAADELPELLRSLASPSGEA